MDTSHDRRATKANDDSAAPNETMSGVGVPGDEATIDGLGFDGRDDHAPIGDDEHPTEVPAAEPSGPSAA